MKNPIAKIFFLLLFTLTACINNESTKTNNQTIKKKVIPLVNNKIELYNPGKNDPLPSDIIQEIKFISLKGYQLKPNDLESKIVKIVDEQIYIFDEVSQQFYCYDLNGNFQYYINLKSYQKDDRNFRSYFIHQKNAVIIDEENRTALTFEKDQLKSSKIVPYWIPEVEINNKNNELIVYQGSVNQDLGSTYYYLNTDLGFDIKKRYLPVSNTDQNAAMNIGTVSSHIFKTDQTINLLTDQNYHIYKYPNLKTPYYTFDFHKYNIDILKALNEKLPSPSLYNFAMIDTFWENDNYILSSYFLGQKRAYILHHKNSNNTFNRYNLQGINDFCLTGIVGSYKNYFYRFISPEYIRKLQSLDKNSHIFLKNYPKNIGNMPVIAFIKLKNL